jgi:hypothetical protein
MDMLKNKKSSSATDDSTIDSKKIRETIAANKANELEQKVKKFRDLDGITTANLNLGLWWVENRAKIKKIIILILLTISIITWTIFIGTFGYYVFFGIKQDDLMIRELAQGPSISHELVMSMGSQPLVFTNVQSFKVGDGRYDFMVQAANPNQTFYEEFDYYFNVDGQAVGQKHGFILPGETKYFFVLGVDLASPPDDIQFRTNGLTKRKIDSRIYPDWENYVKERLNISADNALFIPARSTVLSEKVDLNELNFTLHNNTIFNYWQVNFKIVLSSSGNIVGISEYTADNLMTGESRDISMTIPGSIGHVDNIAIIPELNVIKKDIYIDYNEGAVK